MEFQNSKNDYILRVASPFSWLWVLLFGPFYWVYKGVYRHAILGVLLGMVTIGISHFIYPFCTYTILRKHFLERGWIEIVRD